MKKTIVAMMIMAMTAASVAGCGSSSNDTAAAESTTDAAADTQQTALQMQQTTLQMQQTTLQQLVPRAEQSPYFPVRMDQVLEAHSSSCSVLSRKMQMVIK